MQVNEIFEKLKSQFGDSIIDMVGEAPADIVINVNPDNLFDICHFLRDDESLEFDYLVNLTALDEGENLAAVYHLYSMKLNHRAIIKVTVPKDNPRVASVETIWRAADWNEREAYDMMGIEFEGHHNLIRILSPYDWEGFPLRKDYETPEEYHGMRIPY